MRLHPAHLRWAWRLPPRSSCSPDRTCSPARCGAGQGGEGQQQRRISAGSCGSRAPSMAPGGGYIAGAATGLVSSGMGASLLCQSVVLFSMGHETTRPIPSVSKMSGMGGRHRAPSQAGRQALPPLAAHPGSALPVDSREGAGSRDQRPGQPHHGLHAAQPSVANLARHNLGACGGKAGEGRAGCTRRLGTQGRPPRYPACAAGTQQGMRSGACAGQRRERGRGFGGRALPGAMPLSAASSGWYAAAMPATWVPWLPASTTAHCVH